MGRAKIIFGDQVLQDLTQDTVTPEVLMEGYTAHAANGDMIVGTAIGGTNDYEQLTNQPQINNVTLIGNKSLHDLGIAGEDSTLSIDEAREYELIEGKNILDIPSSVVTTTTAYGVTFTVYRNVNGSVTRININGTSTDGRSELVLKGTAGIFINDIPDGQYVFSGISGGNIGTSYWMDMRYRDDGSSTNNFYSFGDGTADIDWQDKTYDVIRVLVGSGYTANNIDVYPMICTSADWNASHAYEPYHIPVKDAMLRREEQRVLGAKNFANWDAQTTTVTDVTYIVNNTDKTITASWTTSPAAQRNFLLGKTSLPIGKYKLTGGIQGDSAIWNSCFIWDETIGRAVAESTENTKEKEFEITSDNINHTLKLYVCIKGGVTANKSRVFKPMIRLASDPDDTYVPYTMTNRELTDSVVKLENEPYTILATATATESTTYADLLNVIKTAYNALSADKKVRCEIWQNTNGSSLIFKNFAGIGVFISIVMANGSLIIYAVRFDDQYRKLTFSTNGTMTNVDLGTQSLSQNLYLVMR